MRIKEKQAVVLVEVAVAALGSARSSFNYTVKALKMQKNFISLMSDSVKATESSINDVDYTEESVTFSNARIRMQASNYAVMQSQILLDLINELFLNK